MDWNAPVDSPERRVMHSSRSFLSFEGMSIRAYWSSQCFDFRSLGRGGIIQGVVASGLILAMRF